MSNSFTVFGPILDDVGNIAKWKEPLAKRTFSRQTTNLMQLVYGKSSLLSTIANDEHDSSADEESDGDDFFKPKGDEIKVCCRDYLFITLYLTVRGACV